MELYIILGELSLFFRVEKRFISIDNLSGKQQDFSHSY